MKIKVGINNVDNDESLSDNAQLISSTTPSSGNNPIMFPLSTLPLTTSDVLNNMIIRVVDIVQEQAGITPVPMFVDARDTVEHLKKQILDSFQPGFHFHGRYKVRLICLNQYKGKVYFSGSFPLLQGSRAYLKNYDYVPNHAKLNSFLTEYALVRFHFYPCE
jgi:hypothetical protein